MKRRIPIAFFASILAAMATGCSDAPESDAFDESATEGDESSDALRIPSYRLLPGEQLRTGQWLLSLGGHARLTLQPDGNLVLFRVRDGAPLWFSNTAGKGGTYLSMQNDCNLVIRRANHTLVWSTDTTRRGRGTCMFSAASTVIGRSESYMLVVQNATRPNGRPWRVAIQR